MAEMTCNACSAPVRKGSEFCPNCGARLTPLGTPPPPSASRAPKKTIGRGMKRVYGLLVVLLCAAFGYVFVEHLPGKADPVIEQQPSVAMATMYTGQTLEQAVVGARVENGMILVPLASLLEHRIIAFEYRTESGVIPLLAFINTDGKLVTAVRMCEPCNSTTFRIEGTELACGNCETHWKLGNLEGVRGSCQRYPPAPVPSTVEGGTIRIMESDVRNWKMRI